MCDEFCEVGASGNFYTKQDVIETLLERYKNPDYQDIWEAKEFKLTKIATDNYFLTYFLIQDKTRVTRRSTLWRRVNCDWKILYHQGTLSEAENPWAPHHMELKERCLKNPWGLPISCEFRPGGHGGERPAHMFFSNVSPYYPHSHLLRRYRRCLDRAGSVQSPNLSPRAC